MKNVLKNSRLVCLLLFATLLPAATWAQKAEVDRTELPIKGPWYPPITTLDARDAKAPPVFEVKAPKDAPNVVVILLDDLGFGGTSATGSVLADAPLRQARQPGPAVQPVPHHGALLADPAGPQDGSQPPLLQPGQDHRGGDLLPRRHRHAAQRRGQHRGDAPAQRLQHGGLRQVARDRGVGDQPFRSLRPAGRTSRVSTSSTASWAVRPTSGRPPSTTT